MKSRTVASAMLVSLAVIACDRPPAGTPPERRTASTHPMQYYVSLPAGWSKARQWPVAITIAGSGKNWESNISRFAAERDKQRYPFIIVTPVVVTNGGRDRNNPNYNYESSVWDRIENEGRCQFDLDGLRAIVDDVSREFNGDPKSFMTGFSGGGQIAIALAFLYPEKLRAAAIAASNYSGRCITEPTEDPLDKLAPQAMSTDSSRFTTPIRFFNGSEDGAARFLIPQRDSAIAFAKRAGFGNISAEIVQGAPHEPMMKPALAFFNSLLGPNEQR